MNGIIYVGLFFLILLCLIALLAGFIQGLSGFGSVLVALPLMVLFLDLKIGGAIGRHLGPDHQYHPLGATTGAPAPPKYFTAYHGGHSGNSVGRLLS